MVELDDGSLLMRLIDMAERMLNRNAMVDDVFNELAAEITRRRPLPADPRIIGDEATMLITALRNSDSERRYFTPEYAGSIAQPWSMIAGALLPMVRSALGRALEVRREMATRSDPDSQPNYGRRRS